MRMIIVGVFILSCITWYDGWAKSAESHETNSNDIIAIDRQTVWMCTSPSDSPSQHSNQPPHPIDLSSCHQKPLREVNPFQQTVWIKAEFEVSKAFLQRHHALGLDVSGMFSSTTFINGVHIGNKGTPGAAASEETPGKMDVVHPLPNDVLRPGINQLVMHLSGFKHSIKLNRPIHYLRITPYRLPTDRLLRHYWLSLLPFGILVAGVLYYIALAVFKREWQQSWYLPTLCILAASQLLIEVTRGIFAYPYPFHEVRLLLILLLSGGFSFVLLGFVISRFLENHKKKIFGSSILLTVLTIFFTPGFDNKSGLALFIPIFSAIALCLMALKKQKAEALPYTAALSVFLLTLLFAPSQFLDVYFFYIVAGLLMFLFVLQAKEFVQEQTAHYQTLQRADKLQFAIDQAQKEAQHENLKVKQGSEIRVVDLNELKYCKGAGDYVELYLDDNRPILYSSTLTELENTLPSTFLRVHRSYIVNTQFIQSLKRHSSGAGELALSTGECVPVSRRIMPKVRERL
ncbi:LytTR family transcriptional regulator DNA-binding domain-containing protein [Marinibactrum halimedae]|uniref:HTH LytTR-type domain-containing protein n=1 Tax=Marinibactrum halimedae TaxID=1444977 RepID=A0AA37T387_9GAMM|nr:LytTR family transcriptional regulator DNA-binding domain-containing protein [Marinibactrum halimedae]MCD9460897.1 LytTR family transcriptional regulator DNA-binding domain-containing protein [Marinibactrum halimedae]GLS24571.1 hypothetical protein GCM10007877_02850 [Marinibactrum halimedae]